MDDKKGNQKGCGVILLLTGLLLVVAAILSKGFEGLSGLGTLIVFVGVLFIATSKM